LYNVIYALLILVNKSYYGGINQMKTFLSIVASAILATSALAADLPVKAPAPATWLTGYPYATSGMYVGLITEGGGGSVSANVPGIASASLTTTTASIGGTVGYAWGQKGSMVAYSIESSVMATNFNGANQGFALAGPISIDVVGMVWTPVSVIQTAFGLLNIPNPFSAVPPFPNAPAGVTTSNIQAGIGGGFVAHDMTLAFNGIGSNKVWEFAPMVEVALMEQLSNGSAIREFVKTDFPTKGILFGAKQSSATPSTEILAGVQVLF
jgi:hypothetical protein